jgi:hypothetical protein
MSTTHPSTATVVFGANDHFLTKNLEGVTEREAKLPLGREGACVSWILGHIVYWRQEILAMLGEEKGWDPDANRGYRGASRKEPAADPRPWSELVELYVTSHLTLMRTLERGEPAPPIAADLAQLAVHEAYHIGQIGLGRRVLGLPGAI